MLFDNSTFFFKISRSVERQHVLENDPIFIGSKSFIITSWSSSVDRAREKVLSIPVWAHFSKIPSILQLLIGLDWLANLVGKVKCLMLMQ